MTNDFFKRYGFRIIFIIVFLLPFVWMGTKRTLLSNSNNVADWLPSYFVETQQYNWFLEHFPYERFVVVSWQGCTMDDSRLEMFAQKLVPGQTIDNIAQWSGDKNFQAEWGDGSTTDQNAISGTNAGVVQSDGQKIEENAAATATNSATDNLKQKVPEQPYYADYFKSVITGPRLYHLLKEQYSGDGAGSVKLSDAAIYKKLEGTLIGPDGKNTALIVTLSNKAPQGKDLAKVLEAIREIGRQCGVHPPKKIDNRPIVAKIIGAIGSTLHEIAFGRNPDMSGIIIGGPPVDNVAITYEGEHTLQRLAGVCGLIGLFLAWLCFRDIRLTLFVFWISIVSAGAALACVSLTGGRCDAILLSMPALVYVLAMSGAVHMINYYHDAVRENGLRMAPERAVHHAFYPCFFANFTTALGLLSLYTSHLIPITKFGVYSALGVMLQLAVLFYYLPALLYFYPSHKIAAEHSLKIEHNSVMQRIWRVWGNFIIKYSIPVALGCLGLMVFFGYGLTQIKTSVKMMRFFSGDSEIIHHYTWLEEHLGPLVPMEIVVKFDNEKCKFNMLERLHLIEDIDDELRLKLKDSIGGVLSAETALPNMDRFSSNKKKSLKQVSQERATNFMLEKNRAALKDYITVDGNRSLKAEDPLYSQTLSELDIKKQDASRLVRAGILDIQQLCQYPADAAVAGISAEEMEQFRKKAAQWEKDHGKDLWRISIRVWSLKKDIDYALFIDEVKEVVDPLIAKMNAKHFPDLVLANAQENDLKNASKDTKKDAPKTETETASLPVEAIYTGMVPVVYKTQHELLTGLQDSFVSSFIMIGITMAFILRSPVAGFCAMIPNVFPIVIVFGFMGRMGILIDVGTMMTASVALGISVDDTIHFLTWFRDGLDQGMSRKEATLFAYSRCATSMFQTTLIAGLGLSAFALSTFTPTQMFGIMMLAILTAALFGDIIFLAAILNTPIGLVFRPRSNKKKNAVKDSNSDLELVSLPESNDVDKKNEAIMPAFARKDGSHETHQPAILSTYPGKEFKNFESTDHSFSKPE